MPFSLKFEYAEEPEKPALALAPSAEPSRPGPTAVPKAAEPAQKPTAKLPAPKRPAAAAEFSKPEAVKADGAKAAPPAESGVAPKVVSIDAFRKKT